MCRRRGMLLRIVRHSCRAAVASGRTFGSRAVMDVIRGSMKSVLVNACSDTCQLSCTMSHRRVVYTYGMDGLLEEVP